MMAAHADPVLMAGLHEEYRQEIAAAGFDPDKVRPFHKDDHGTAITSTEPAPKFVPTVQTTRSRGQGADMAIPVHDRD